MARRKCFQREDREGAKTRREDERQDKRELEFCSSRLCGLRDLRVKNLLSERRTMANRIFNFSAGPAMLPTTVLERSAETLLDYKGSGFGIAECSHRGKEFDCVIDEAI